MRYALPRRTREHPEVPVRALDDVRVIRREAWIHVVGPVDLTTVNLAAFDAPFVCVRAALGRILRVGRVHVVAAQRIVGVADEDLNADLEDIEARRPVGRGSDRLGAAFPRVAVVVGCLVHEVRPVAVEHEPHALVQERLVLELPRGAVGVVDGGLDLPHDRRRGCRR